MEKYCKNCGRVFKGSDFKICPYCGNHLSIREGRQPIPRKLRHLVFQRDNYRCRECGATNQETRLHIDHIIPVAKGGTNDLSNLQTLCEACNRAKYTDIWIGGIIVEPSNNHLYTTCPKCGIKYQKNRYFSCPNCIQKSKTRTQYNDSVTICDCGFKYNLRFHNACPNCKKPSKTRYKVNNIRKQGVVKCSCGFKYNLRFHNACPNCKKPINRNPIKNNHDLYTICPKCGKKYQKNRYFSCPNCG